MGLLSTRVHHRLGIEFSNETNHFCEPIEIITEDSAFVFPPKQSRLVLTDNRALPAVNVGVAHVTSNGLLVKEPMDFCKKNYMSLLDLQDLLVKLVRPDILVSVQHLQLGTPPIQINESLRMMAMEAMAQYPRASGNPHLKQQDYPDDYCKLFLPGLARVRSKRAIRVYNKIGQAYGFTIDNAYILDIETGRSFFLTAVVYTNANGIVNDDQYEYSVAESVMADLGEVVSRSFWKISPELKSLSSILDCTPSSLWKECTIPCATYISSSQSVSSSEENVLLIGNCEEISQISASRLGTEDTSGNLVKVALKSASMIEHLEQSQVSNLINSLDVKTRTWQGEPRSDKQQKTQSQNLTRPSRLVCGSEVLIRSYQYFRDE